MPTIEVTKAFTLRLNSRSERREFAPGRHEVSGEELGHWFMKGAIKEGRAHVVADAPAKAEAKEPAGPEGQEAATETQADAEASETPVDAASAKAKAEAPATTKGKGK